MSKTLAWIDDDHDLLESVVEPLGWAGHRVQRYRTVQEALDKHDEIAQADLVLLDMILPTGSLEEVLPAQHYTGVGLLRKLRDEYGLRSPVIVLTLVRNAQLEHDLFDDLNVARILHKPILPSELRAEVYDVLGLEP